MKAPIAQNTQMALPSARAHVALVHTCSGSANCAPLGACAHRSPAARSVWPQVLKELLALLQRLKDQEEQQAALHAGGGSGSDAAEEGSSDAGFEEASGSGSDIDGARSYFHDNALCGLHWCCALAEGWKRASRVGLHKWLCVVLQS